MSKNLRDKVYSELDSVQNYLKEIRTGIETISKNDLLLKINESLVSISNSKVEVSEFQNLLLQKDEEIRLLKEKSQLKEDLYFEAPYYKSKKDPNGSPFCQQCFDSQSKHVRLQPLHNGHWECQTCKNVVKDKSYREIPYQSGYEDD